MKVISPISICLRSVEINITSSSTSPQLFSSAHENCSNSSLQFRWTVAKQSKSVLLWEWIPKNRTIQCSFWFQSEFRTEKLNLILNWNLGVGGKKHTQSWGWPCILQHLLHSYLQKRGGGLLFQNSFLGQKHRRQGTTGDYGGLGETTGD